MHGLLILKRHNVFQTKIIEKPHTALLPELFQQEVLKLNNIYVS